MRLAVAKYRIGRPQSFEAFAAGMRAALEVPARQGARIAVLPEYLSLELAATCAPDVSADLPASLAAIQRHRQAWLQLFTDLAGRTGMLLVAGSFLLDQGAGRYRNRCDLFTPAGRHHWQDKLQLTGFEKRSGVIDGGDALKVFDWEGLRLAVAICYDVEFPLPVRAQYEAGARLLLVPSCTDTEAGATRVRVGCMARALENRCFVAQAVTAGEAAWSAALDVNTGEAAVYAPMDAGFQDDGVVARTRCDDAWAIADVDVDALARSRAAAQVANDRDWPGQRAPGIATARVEPL